MFLSVLSLCVRCVRCVFVIFFIRCVFAIFFSSVVVLIIVPCLSISLLLSIPLFLFLRHRRRRQVEPVQMHHLSPRRHEVLDVAVQVTRGSKRRLEKPGGYHLIVGSSARVETRHLSSYYGSSACNLHYLHSPTSTSCACPPADAYTSAAA